MKIIDRIIVIIFTLILIFTSIVMMLSAFELIPQDYLTSFVYQHYGQIGVGIVGFVFFLIAIRILYPLFRRDERGQNAIVKENSLGQVRLSLSAIDGLVKKVVNQTSGVREIESDLKVEEEGLMIFLELVVTPDIDIPELTEDLQEQIKEYLKRTTGVVVDRVEILVDSIDQESNLRVE